VKNQLAGSGEAKPVELATVQDLDLAAASEQGF
jgi:hypothetical protein